MSEDVKPGPSGEQVSSLEEVLAKAHLSRTLFDQPADKPSKAEKLATWAQRMDTASASLLSLWLRVCFVMGSGLSVAVLFMLVWSPDSISTVVELIELIVSSGRGFAIPTLVLISLLPKLIGIFANLRE